MKKLNNIHPGQVLNEEFIKPLNISAYRISKETNIPQTRISEIIKGKRKITADTALRLSKFFGNSPQFWLGLQNDFDLEEERTGLAQELMKIHEFSAGSTQTRIHA
jgi:antitoxin HigA-1